jgi:hypothetical protein
LKPTRSGSSFPMRHRRGGLADSNRQVDNGTRRG